MRILKLKREKRTKLGDSLLKFSASRAAHSVLPVLELTRWGSWTYLPEVDGKPQQFENEGGSRALEMQLLLKA